MQHISSIVTKLEAKLQKQSKALNETEAHISVLRRILDDDSQQTDIEAVIAESKNKKDGPAK